MGVFTEAGRIVWAQVYRRVEEEVTELFCMSSIVGGGPLYTIVLGANFHRAYYTVYAYDARTNTPSVRTAVNWLCCLETCYLFSTHALAGPCFGTPLMQGFCQSVSRSCMASKTRLNLLILDMSPPVNFMPCNLSTTAFHYYVHAAARAVRPQP